MSIFRDPDRVTELSDLLRHTISSIKPTVVVASGDLTDARVGLGSLQHREEWKRYHDTVQESGVLEYTTWMDIRGNHDTFNVEGFNGPSDFFKNYSVQGPSHPRSYSHQVTVNKDSYTFMAVDASLIPGPKRPFNFIGELSQEEINNIRKLISDSNGTDYRIWFSHYPTSCIMSPGVDTNIREIIGGEDESLVYLCGHLHTFAGMVPRMISLQTEGFLELEVGDWMRNRIFRLAAVDHGHFSFVDVRYNRFPIVLITNPKDASLHIPQREDLSVALESTHIRILAFSNAPITECHVRIYKHTSTIITFQSQCAESEKAKNLFVAAWDPQKYRQGGHRIEVTIKDEAGRSTVQVHRFCFDGSDSGGQNFSLMARFLLMTNFQIIAIVMFIVVYSVCVLPMSCFRIWHWVTVKRGGYAPQIQSRWLRVWVRKYWLLSSVDRLFYPLILFYSFILMGPWMVGEVIDGYTGWVFMWGIFVKGTFFPGTLTYLYGFNQLLLCQMPLLMVYAGMLDHKFRNEWNGRGQPQLKKNKTNCQAFWPHLPFALIIIVEVVLAGFYLVEYGIMSLLLCPLRFWSVVVHMYLFHQVYRLEEKSVREGIAVWSNGAKPG